MIYVAIYELICFCLARRRFKIENALGVYENLINGKYYRIGNATGPNMRHDVFKNVTVERNKNLKTEIFMWFDEVKNNFFL